MNGYARYVYMFLILKRKVIVSSPKT